MLGAVATTLAANATSLRATGLPAATAAGVVILTSWDFGPEANTESWPILARGGLAIDAVEVTIN